MAPIKKDALQEVVAERLAKQGNKTPKQLYVDARVKKTKKVSNFAAWQKVEKVDLSYIPGREKRKEDERAVKLRMKKAKEAAEQAERAQTDWTATDEYGNLDISVTAQCLELSGVPDPSADLNTGPIYPRGKRIHGIDLHENLENANSKTFVILQPKKRGEFNLQEQGRFRLATTKDAPKPFTLHERESEGAIVNPQTGTIETECLYINAVALADDEVFKIGRALQRSQQPHTVDFYGNYLMDGPIAFLADRVTEGLRQGRELSLHSISLCMNTLGPATYPALSSLMGVSTTLTSLNLSNAFDPMSDMDGAGLMQGLERNGSLRHIDLTGNMLSQKFAWELRTMLLTNTSLETLKLDCNLINDDAVFFVAEALSKNKRSVLTRFSATNNLIDHVGFGALMEVCKQDHCRLRYIDLQNNKISRCSSGAVTASISRTTSLEVLNIAQNRVSDITEIGLGLYLNRSLKELICYDNNIADDTMTWFAMWGKDKSNLASSKLHNLDLRGNKIGDRAALHLVMGMRHRKFHRTLNRLDISDNLADPLLVQAVAVFMDPTRPYKFNKMQAEKLVKQKKKEDKKYWKEREWEALQKKRKEALDEAVRRLNSRTEDEVELEVVVGATLASRIPVVKQIASVTNQLRFGVKPIWQLQSELITQQKQRAALDIAFRKSLIKGIKN
mmetsp:Transcript_9898/g.23877  ORF Transcript_9898/g.23877 Transcript_9898/m.23877 type:complete len:674 (+) Transcript_9898:46-2067(+)